MPAKAEVKMGFYLAAGFWIFGLLVMFLMLNVTKLLKR